MKISSARSKARTGDIRSSMTEKKPRQENARTAKKNTSCLDEFHFDTQYFTVCMQLTRRGRGQQQEEYRHCATVSPSSIFSVFDQQQYVDSYYSVMCPPEHSLQRAIVSISMYVGLLQLTNSTGHVSVTSLRCSSLPFHFFLLLPFRRSLFILLGKRRGTDRYALQTFLYALKDATRFLSSFYLCI